jgi:hypothetical protein
MEINLNECNLRSIRENVTCVVADHKGESEKFVSSLDEVKKASVEFGGRGGRNGTGGRQMMPREITGPQF